LAEESKSDAGEHVGAGCATMSQNSLASFHHMGCIWTVTCQFQGVIYFYAATEVKIAATVKIPSSVLTLMLAKVHSDLGLELMVNLVYVMHHEYIFSRDGTIGFKIKTVVAVGVLQSK
jgi:hypothetical protein